MNSKKYGALLLASTLAISVGIVGCGGDKKEEPQKATVKQEQQVKQVRYGYISGNDVILREGPSTSTKVLDGMNKGYKVEILEEVKTGQEYPWYKIKTTKGQLGYTFGKFVSTSEIKDSTVKATPNVANGISVPGGYKLLQSTPDYIVVRCAEESMMGGPKYCYDKASIDYCATTINKCMGAKTIIGGYDDEIITIFKNGTVSVLTTIGSNTIQRFYKKPDSNNVMNNSLETLVVFKLEKDNGGWKRHENGTRSDCGCGNRHVFKMGRDAEGRFVYTTREGIRDYLKRKWN